VSDGWDKAVSDYDRTLGTNLRGAYLVGRAAIPYLLRQGGDLVNVTTDHIHTCGWPDVVRHADASTCPWAAVPRPPGGGTSLDLYDASKWGLNGLTHAWARDLYPHGIRVNSFGMGATDTPMYRRFLRDRSPMPGMMSPEAIAAVLLDLLAEGSDGRTGDSIQLWVGHPCALPPVATHPAVVT
jgi:NAD(P)-dependent dehydrogenase (short-subunit alcohol dehydrogenase family)